MRRDALGYPGHELIAVELATTSYHRDRDLTVRRVRTRDDGGVGDLRVGDQERLEVAGAT